MLIGESTQPPFYRESVVTRQEIICWWEGRRFRYNFYMGIVGIVSWLLVEVAGSAAVKPGEDFEEPIIMIFGLVLYAILANLCYTFGWIVDVSAYRGRPREGLFKGGFIFSLALTALPGIWAVVALLITMYTGRKL
jgi:hypothetical protein